MLAAFKVALCVHSRQDEIVVGVPFTGEAVSGFDSHLLNRARSRSDNLLPLHTPIVWDQTFAELLDTMAFKMLEIHQHGYAEFEDIVDVLEVTEGKAFDPARHPVFQAILRWKTPEVFKQSSKATTLTGWYLGARRSGWQHSWMGYPR